MIFWFFVLVWLGLSDSMNCSAQALPPRPGFSVSPYAVPDCVQIVKGISNVPGNRTQKTYPYKSEAEAIAEIRKFLHPQAKGLRKKMALLAEIHSFDSAPFLYLKERGADSSEIYRMLKRSFLLQAENLLVPIYRYVSFDIFSPRTSIRLKAQFDNFRNHLWVMATETGEYDWYVRPTLLTPAGIEKAKANPASED